MNVTLPYRHGMTNTRFHNCWRGMKDRCTSENNIYYKGRGITLLPSWKYFGNFYKDMFESFKKHAKKHGEKNTTIERIDNNKGYSKENCRWATNQEQWRNKRDTRLINYKGVSLPLTEWARKLGISQRALHYRLENWDYEKVFTTPKLDNNKKITYKKETKTLIEWEEETNLPIRVRLSKGWSVSRTFNQPLNFRHRDKNGRIIKLK